nr:unnamed protein product [Digitaria exilis]
MVEIYFWTCGMLHEEEYSHSPLLFAKTFGMVSLLDDTFDVHATFEECHKLNEAMQRTTFITHHSKIYLLSACRWDESVAPTLPEYLRMLYIKTLRNFKEFEDMLESNKKYRMSYAKNAVRAQY